MMKIKKALLAAVFAIFVGGSVMGVISTPATYAAPLTTCDKATKVLTFPVWYRGLNDSPAHCEIVSPDKVGGTSEFIWIIVLNLIDIALNAVGYITVGYMMYGGFLLMTARGEPENITKGRKTIQNAAIGLIISVGSIAIVNLIVSPAAGIIK